MTVGDNFDTSSLGTRNRRTKRYAGSLETAGLYGQWYQENNFGHPCNIGCGCKKVCDGLLGPCLLPPELQVTLVKSSSGRVSARIQTDTKGSQGFQRFPQSLLLRFY